MHHEPCAAPTLGGPKLAAKRELVAGGVATMSGYEQAYAPDIEVQQYVRGHEPGKRARRG